ncbi:hypothetical protein [Thermomonas sp.]|jgi:hypothetical protein|uniref:hypothetical protein n=1 Tax=Thermomonas sp. TaxID=1971895 RepID=UPI00257E398A|nr:hypothetical protein [Thermomonas sp.]
MALSPRSGFVTWLLLAGVGLALFFTGEYRDLPLPLGWLGMFLFVAAVWFSVAQLHAVAGSDEQAQVAPGEWQAWVGVAFASALIVALIFKAELLLPQLPIHRNPDAGAAGKSIGTLFVAWLVLAQVLKQRWAGRVQADERDARIELVAGQWARSATAFGVVGIAVTLGFSDTGRLRDFSYPFIAQMLMLALLCGLWVEQLAMAVLYRRDRRGAQA